jgi:hypothetical protein
MIEVTGSRVASPARPTPAICASLFVTGDRTDNQATVAVLNTLSCSTKRGFK